MSIWELEIILSKSGRPRPPARSVRVREITYPWGLGLGGVYPFVGESLFGYRNPNGNFPSAVQAVAKIALSKYSLDSKYRSSGPPTPLETEKSPTID